jgi:hypothetical protein
VVDQLAKEYAGQPVIFLEYDVDDAPSSRNSRFWRAYGLSSVMLPEVMVDSGNQITNGYESFYSIYKSMVDKALARPPQANIQATWMRSGNKISFTAKVTNQSGVTLSAGNYATVHAIVYEETHVYDTDRFVRAAISTPINSLVPNATGTYSLETAELSGLNWDKLHYIVLVDYAPSGSSGAYDMLQAAVANPTIAFDVHPDSIYFMTDSKDADITPASIHFEGANDLFWTTSFSPTWMDLTPKSGSLDTPATVSVNKDALTPGWQQETLTFVTTEGSFSDQLVVKAYYGDILKAYLPQITR